MSTQGNGNNLLVQGRIVWVTGSSLFEGKQKTDYNTNAPQYGADGSPTMEYGFGLSIPKLDPATGQQSTEFAKIWAALHNEAYTLYPDGNIPPSFAMKYKDGDTIDHNGKPFADREGYKGCIVLTCTTQIAIKYFKFMGGNNVLVNEGIKCGDYVNVQLNLKAHPAKGNGKPGLYVNPTAVQLIQEGKAIVNTPSGDQLFGTAAPAYNGEVIADTAPAMPTVGQAQAAPAPQAPVAPVAAPVAPVAAPNFGVLPQQHQPAPAPQAPAAPQAAPTMPGIPPMPQG